ncbi:MAG: helicase [Planctomycetes bacterium]|nr:helicase [Planctomycetota bacterium]
MTADPAEPTDGHFHAEVIAEIAGEIQRAGGNEVFFFGTIDDGILSRVEVVARGHASAVPVFIDRAEEHHHVLIHNHPSGNLTPSSPDLRVASEAGMRGLGFFIVDNAATRVYRVVEPAERRAELPIDVAEIEEIFSAGGRLARAIPSFEDRAGQRELAIATAEAINGRRVVAFEAGTGVGKSFAYLVPSILWAVANQSRVVVSTQTIALSEQLVTKDLPVLTRALGVDFRFALIKGRGNYACRRKTGEVTAQKGLFGSDPERINWIETLVDRIPHSRTGSLSELDELPPEDVWDDFRSTTDQSLKTRCPHYQECFYYEARRVAARAHVLVANHHLFFADLSVRRAVGGFDDDLVLPSYSRVIFDEAHRLEEVACQHLGGGFSRIGLLQLLGRLASNREARGRLPFVSSVLKGKARVASSEFLDRNLIPKVSDTRAAVLEAMDSLGQRIGAIEAESKDGSRGSGATGSEVSRPETPGGPIARRIGSSADDVDPELLEEPLLLLRDELQDLQRAVRQAWNLLLDEPFEPESKYEGCLAEYRSAFSGLAGAVAEIEGILSQRRGFVAWAELRPGRRGNLIFRHAPVRVSDILADDLYARVGSAVMTSATLSIGDSWSFLADRLGWDKTEAGRFQGRVFPSPFDFHAQSLLAVPRDFPPPESRSFVPRFVELVRATVSHVRGRTFVLFTSHQMLRRVAGELQDEFERAGYPCLVQGTRPQSELLRRFRESGRAVLFGNQTFWEGVDVPGQALSCVVIARLPFRVPSHPLERARVEEIEGRGEAPFFKLTVPQAALTLKQGFGRLIRTTDDRGAVVIADSRVVTKPYGRRFLESLPEGRRVVADWREVDDAIARFFAESSP